MKDDFYLGHILWRLFVAAATSAHNNTCPVGVALEPTAYTSCGVYLLHPQFLLTVSIASVHAFIAFAHGPQSVFSRHSQYLLTIPTASAHGTYS